MNLQDALKALQAEVKRIGTRKGVGGSVGASKVAGVPKTTTFSWVWKTYGGNVICWPSKKK